MAVPLARGEIALDPDLTGFEGALRGSLFRVVGGLSGALGGAFAGVQLGQFFQSAVTESIGLIENINRVKVVFGDLAPEVLKIGDTAAASLGLTRSAAIGTVGDLGNLLTSFGLTGSKAAEMSLRLTTLAADLASFNNLAGGSGEALVAIRAALVGEVEPIRRLGVSFDDQQLKQKAAELGLYKFRGAASSAGNTASAVAKAVERLGDVQRTTAQRMEDLQRSAADRQVAAAERIIGANKRVESAEARLQDVQRSSVDAQRRLNDARIEAKRRLDDLTFAVGDNALAQRQASLNIRKAIEEQKRVKQDDEATELDRLQATLDVAQARRDAVEVARDNANEERDLNDARSKGVNGADAVVSALDAIAQAQRDTRDAERDRIDALGEVTKAQADAARTQEDSAREIARAQEDAARDIVRAQRDIAEAGKSSASSVLGPDVLDPAVKAQAAYALILDKTKNAQGDFLRTAGDPANRIRILQARIGDLKAQIGDRLLPTFVKFLGFIETKVVPIIERQLNPAFDHAPTIFERVGQAIKFVSDNLPGLILGLGLLVLAVDTPLAVGTAFVALLGFLIVKIPAVRQAIGIVIEVLTVMAETLVAVLGSVASFITGAITGFTSFASTVGGLFVRLWDGAKAVFSGAIDFIELLFDNWFRVMLGFATLGLSEVVGFIVRHFTDIRDFIGNVVEGIIDFFVKLPGHIVRGLLGAAVGIFNFFRDLAADVFDFVKDLPQKFFDLGMDIIEGLINGIKSLPGRVAGALVDIGKDAIGQVGHLFGIGSPSKVFMGFGRDIVAGLALGIERDAASVAASTADLAARVNAAFAEQTRSGAGSAFAPAVVGATPAAASGPTQIDQRTWGPITVIDNTGDPETTAQALAARMGMAARR